MTAAGSIPGLTYEWSIAVSAAFAAIVCTLITIVIEKFGGLLGGVLGSVPTTIIPASLGFYYQYRFLGSSSITPHATQAGLEEYQKSMISVVPGMILNAFFLLMWRYLPALYRKSYPTLTLYRLLILVFATAIVIWLGLAVGLVSFLRAVLPSNDIPESSVDSAKGDDLELVLISKEMVGSFSLGFGALLVLASLGLASGWNPPPAPRAASKVAPLILVARGFFAGIAIGIYFHFPHRMELTKITVKTGASILIGRISPWAGGVASVFPVIFTTSMVAVWVSSGEAVSAGAIGSLMLGSASVGSYALFSAIFVPVLGFWGVTAVAWIVSVVGVSLPSFLYLRWRREVTASDDLKDKEATNPGQQ
ncbi:hypothetical protein BC828DRAFT_379305 [Blastocladiella britannica]|nr:hypothetical protein BC828DRAFT_379305 [Blastocladiella britannica]